MLGVQPVDGSALAYVSCDFTIFSDDTLVDANESEPGVIWCERESRGVALRLDYVRRSKWGVLTTETTCPRF